MRNALEELLRKSFKLFSQKGLSFARCSIWARKTLDSTSVLVVLSKAVFSSIEKIDEKTGLTMRNPG
ncbi:MAG: hypothetical protein A3G33_06795 [Omnitrophica bacterium RIFCSPLOWO2_12_FULL_44_17]|uniref:Uncharacterized protein n=1 Tax=Candidatus Danuiimicrobium aquiferis TaxID=1801832 RepID=A0A1G1L3E3_9BACT|nr:MAG: hypothetical protein A3B72_03375 [Omnitrophica bacterium RIFCSPHIGHO2_02_FULL_45_28]OGW88375.1 MAG: hypothetical protein A3E74_09105 [Omnitrophica bacterium RIFCSPHIGHO2_12_FULL_44_12]OGW99389.1 MAG: hypothetical protein A3G33_06795 [Omnitrophica bacterium RIFCSPLOWO2_12_FULL_44_17]OGX03425.1 MAG: hypothetical protein A3J12_11640 [Omnitrophica bacterium RIFCSPLOWO2_02_FULL_44_11]